MYRTGMRYFIIYSVATIILKYTVTSVPSWRGLVIGDWSPFEEVAQLLDGACVGDVVHLQSHLFMNISIAFAIRHTKDE